MALRSFSDFMTRSGHLVWGPSDVRWLNSEEAQDDSIDVLEHHRLGDGDYPRFSPFSKDEIDRQRSHRRSFSTIEEVARKAYKNNSTSVNHRLRHGVPSPYLPRNDGDSFIKHLDRITSLPLSEPVTLYRGFNLEFPIHRLRPGDSFVDHGFVGTSRKFDAVKQHGYPHLDPKKDPVYDYPQLGTEGPLKGMTTLAVIHAPEGTRGHLLDIHENEKSKSPGEIFGDEHEFLLGRGTRFRVRKRAILHGFGTRQFPWHDHDMRRREKFHVIHLDVTGQGE